MSPPAGSPKRILLFAEAVTLAHVARPLCFAAGLDRSRYRVAIATAQWASGHVKAAGIEHLALESIEPRRFLAALAKGSAVYDSETLQRYVQNDLELIERFEPDLIVGDFRLSLSVSARLVRVPYVTIASAYWSPYYTPPRWPVPSLPMTRWLPLGIAQAIFTAARPLAFAMHCEPLNRVRVRNGLAPLPRDLRRIYTDADYVAYSDLPELFPMAGMPFNHRFLGPALWQPMGERPSWWAGLPIDRPCLYVTLGSSGEARLLPRIVEALATLPVTLLVSCAEAMLLSRLPENVKQADYLPGLEAAQRSGLVICNGGSLAAYQALAGGAVVLGIAANLDQFLNMQALERAGVGEALRADRLSPKALCAAAARLLSSARQLEPVRVLRKRCAMFRFEVEAALLVGELTAKAG